MTSNKNKMKIQANTPRNTSSKLQHIPFEPFTKENRSFGGGGGGIGESLFPGLLK